MQIDDQLLDAAAGNGFLLTKAMVVRSGISEHQWARRRREGHWLQVVPGVWHHRATPLTFELKVRAAATWLGRNAALYGAAAGRWLGLEGCETERVEFLVPRGRRHLSPWLGLHTTHSWTSGDLLTVDGVRTCNATRAIIDMATSARPRAVEAAIDSAVRLRRTSVPTLVRRIDELGGSGRPGTRLLRTLMLDSGGESYLERRFLRIIREHGFPRPSTQVTHRPGTTLVIRVDFEFPAFDVVVEVSGKRGHSSDRDRREDVRRRNWLTGIGKTVTEFTTADVLDDPEYVVTTLQRHVSRHPIPGNGAEE